MDEEYGIEEPTPTVQCLQCGVNLPQSEMGRHTVTCDEKEYTKRLREKAEAAALKRTLQKLLK